ncbi:hypothetical protein [Ferruginibacter sp.]|uniref:hypothetical protein n=1 Tax=Ferruginibacter sp. TaxID=1940288 RepID=UPI002659C672|nr:hypothetical protein [Ferruginibacter sp.]
MMKIVYRGLNPVLKPNQSEEEYYTEKENGVLDGVFSYFTKLMEFYSSDAGYPDRKENEKRFIIQYTAAKEDYVDRITAEYAGTNYLDEILALTNERFCAFDDAVSAVLGCRFMTA